MDWTAAIERNGKALKRILAMLVAMAGGSALTSPLWGFEADLPIEPVTRSSAEKAGEIAEQSGSPAESEAWRGGSAPSMPPTRPPEGGNAPLKAETAYGFDGPLIRPLRGHLLPAGEQREPAFPRPSSPLVERVARAKPEPGEEAILIDDRPALEAETAPTLPRHLHRAILRLLRPAEAAARRLVIVAARDIVVAPARPRRRKPVPTSIFVRDGKGTGIVLPRGVRPGDILPGLARPRPARRTFSLPLTDRLPAMPRPRALAGGVPRISMPGISSRAPVRRPPLSDDLVDATRLSLRLQAIGRVLDDLPGHARRFARWRMRADAAAAQMKHSAKAAPRMRLWPLRPGPPPGGRRRPTHEVHEVLADLHHFAFRALERRTDSS